MKNILIATVLSLACTSANAINWPGQEPASPQAWDYCMGLVLGGLASNNVSGMSRSELWQAWSYLIRSGALTQMTPSDEYRAGMSLFQEAADATAAETVLEDAMGDCGLGRSGYQITGW